MKDIDLLNRLESDAAIVAIIADRIWTSWLPENAVLPAITCNYESDTPSVTLTNDLLRSRENITVNIWTESKTDCTTLISLITARLNGFAVRGSMIDLSEEERGLYRYAIDYTIF